MKTKFLLCILSMVLLGGCRAGLNVQRASLRSGADVGVTTYLDEINIEKVPERKTVILQVATDIERFLKDGNVSDLPLVEIKAQLYKIVPLQYHQYVDQVLAAVSGLRVPTEKVGKDNIRRMVAVCQGLITAVNEYDDSDHPTETE